jgi:hypothetical protein
MSEMTDEEKLAEIERLKREAQAQDKTKIDVTVDTRQIQQQLAEKIEWEQRAKSGIAVDVGKQLLQKLLEKADSLGIEYEEPKSMEDFEALARTVKDIEKEQNRKAPSGSIPLSPAQTGNRETNEGFDSYEEMISWLQDHSNRNYGSTEPNEADMILTELWRKYLTNQMKGSHPNISYERTTDTPLGKELNERFKRRKELKEKGEI